MQRVRHIQRSALVAQSELFQGPDRLTGQQQGGKYRKRHVKQGVELAKHHSGSSEADTVVGYSGRQENFKGHAAG